MWIVFLRVRSQRTTGLPVTSETASVQAYVGKSTLSGRAGSPSAAATTGEPTGAVRAAARAFSRAARRPCAPFPVRSRSARRKTVFERTRSPNVFSACVSTRIDGHVAEGEIARGVARGKDGRVEPLHRISRVAEIDVRVARDDPFAFDVGQRLRDDGLQPVAKRLRRDGLVRVRDRERRLKVGAVRHVIVHEEVRLPRVGEREEGARLLRIGLHEVPVQVQAARVRPEAHFLRTVLVRAVVRRDPRVPVHVVDDDRHERDAVEEVEPVRERDVAQQDQRRVRAVHLSGMDGIENEDDGLRRPCTFRRARRAFPSRPRRPGCAAPARSGR